MNLRKLTDQATSLFASKTDASASASSGLVPKSSNTATDATATASGKSFRDYVKSTTEQTGSQRLGDIALTESYGSALAAQILAARSQDVTLAQSEFDKRQTAFDKDLKQVMTDNGIDSSTLPKLDVAQNNRITVSGIKDSAKLETILNSTPGVAEALDELVTAKAVLNQMHKQVATAANAGPSFSVSFDGARAQLAAEKKITDLGTAASVQPTPATAQDDKQQA